MVSFARFVFSAASAGAACAFLSCALARASLAKPARNKKRIIEQAQRRKSRRIAEMVLREFLWLRQPAAFVSDSACARSLPGGRLTSFESKGSAFAHFWQASSEQVSFQSESDELKA